MPLVPAFFPASADDTRDASLARAKTSLRDADPSRFADLPRGLLATLGVLAVLSLLTVNGPLTAASVVVLGALVALLWRPGEPPILLFAAGYQWVQATAKVFHADVFGVYIEALSPSPSIRAATWLSLIGLVVLAAGMRLGLRGLAPQGERLGLGVADFSTARAFWLYAGVAAFTAVVMVYAWSVWSLTQILLAVVGMKWAAFFVLAYLVFQRREGYAYFAFAFGIELVQGVGFFSEFKTVFFVTLLAAFATRVRLTFGTVVGATAVLAVLLVMGSAWTVVKPEFRSAISEDAATMQSSGESQGAMVTRLGNMVLSLNGDDLVRGLDPLFQRVAYTDFFAFTIDYVPAHRPYGRGELWGTAVKHVLTPRLLFPDKPALLSDSEVTMAYTGQYMASDAQGTSISIGYMGEAYADFGPVGMFGVVLLVGIGWGLIYAYFVRRARVPLIGLSFALVILLSAYLFEVASIKLVGGVLMKFIVLALLYGVLETWLADWLRGGAAEDEAVSAGTDYVAQAGGR